jgi:thiosulfate dehydrogenase
MNIQQLENHMKKSILFALIFGFTIGFAAIPNGAYAKTVSVQPNCDAMADWYECRDVNQASLLVQDGYNMIHNTPTTLGPWGDYKGPDGGPVIKTTLSCDSRHFAGGQAPGGIPFFQVRDKYAPPCQYWRAVNHKRLIAERINWCMVSCANGQMVDENSYEMQAMIAYIGWVAEGITDPNMLALPDGWKNIPGHDLPLVNKGALSMTSDPVAGKQIYELRCD